MAFLNAELDEEIYVLQPDGFVVSVKENHVYLLRKPLYGLKQASRQWHTLLESVLVSKGFTVSWVDPSLFVHWDAGLVVLVIVYVDDFLVTGSDTKYMDDFVTQLQKRFTVRICNEIGNLLGISILESGCAVKLHQSAMIEGMLRYINLTECTPVTVPLPHGTDLNSSVGQSDPFKDVRTFQQLLGSLMHLSNTTRTDTT